MNEKENIVPIISRLTASFTEKSTEAGFRQNSADYEKKQNFIGIGISIIPLMALLYSDFIFFGFSSAFYSLLALRFTVLSVTIIALAMIARTKNSGHSDIIVFLWLLLFFTSATLIYMTRPPENIRNAYIDIPVILLVYLVFNIRFIFLVVPPVLYTGISLFMIINAKELPGQI
ncbi:MAG: hypothetical protein ACRCUT_13625, partial [Spirochaetota bacterium]